MTEERQRARLLVGGIVVLAAMVAAILVWSPFPRTSHPETHALLDDQGQLAMAMPTLADDIAVTRNDDGSADLVFSIDYDVAHPGHATPPTPGSNPASTTTAKPDMAVVTVMVSPHQGAGGPIRVAPLFRRQIEDRSLDEAATTSRYDVRLFPSTVAFLDQQGLGSDDADTKEKALRYIDVDVEHLRDFQVVDGRYDWQQGRAYTAADQPVHGTDLTDDSTVTVTNTTAEGIAGPSQGQVWDDGTIYGGPWDPIDDTSAYGTNVALSGAAVECIEQGDGSNPQGFSMLNGWDLQDDLPPGFLPPGGAITEQVDANESLSTASLDVAENTTAATVQTVAAVGDYATGGAKDAATYGYLVALGVEELSSAATIALGVPIMSILGLAQAIHDAETDSCASFANIFNLTAVEPDGAQTSVSWGDQTDGLQLTYDSASHDGTPVTGNVQAVASNQLAVSAVSGYEDPVAFHPYLIQDPVAACGTGSPGPTDPYCGGSEAGNNVIDIGWSNLPMCPYKPAATACAPTAAENLTVPEVTIPGTDLCGTDNELCPTTPAPNPQAAEVDPAEAEAGDGYQLVDEFNPSSPVTAVAEVDAGTIWTGTASGEIQQFDGEGFTTFEADDSNGAITAMGASGSWLVWGDEGGNLFQADTADGTWSPDRVSTAPGPIDDLVADGSGGFAYATSSELFTSSGPGGSVAPLAGPDAGGLAITDLAAGPDDLYVGFAGGEIWRCPLDGCAGHWSEVHDDGFDSDVQAMAAVGDTLYVGLANGAQAQIQAADQSTVVYEGPQGEGGTVAGMAEVDGNVFVGGCIGIQSPVSGDLLGVEVLTDVGGTASAPLPAFDPAPPYQDCQNPSETTTKYKGFEADQYALVASPATATHPPLVYVALTVDAENFFYVLESTSDFTDALCGSGPCPVAPPIPTPPAPPPAPVGSLGAMGTPLVAASCGAAAQDAWSPATADPDTTFAAASAQDPLQTAAGESVVDGFELTPVTSGSATCTTTWAWNLDHVGELPYVTWQGNAYPAASTPGAQSWAVGTSLHEPIDVAVDGTAVPEGSTDPSGSTQDLPTLTAVDIASSGSQLQASIAGADALVLQLTTSPGAAASSLVVTSDVLTTTGQAVPAPVDLFVAPDASASSTSTTTGITSTTSASATTTSAPPATTTTTLAPGCVVPVLPGVGTSGVLWPLDDRSTTAVDASGRGYDATIAGAEAYDQAPGPMPACPDQGALQFDGATTTVTAPASADAALDDQHVSLLASVKVPTGLADGYATVIGNDDPDDTGNGTAIYLTIRNGAVTQVTWELGLTTGVMDVVSDAGLSANTWHQLAGVFDTSTRQGTLWVDGQAVAIGTAPGSLDPYLQAGSSPITLGVNPDVGTYRFEGFLADVAVVPVALTSAQLAAAWAATQGS